MSRRRRERRAQVRDPGLLQRGDRRILDLDLGVCADEQPDREGCDGAESDLLQDDIHVHDRPHDDTTGPALYRARMPNEPPPTLPILNAAIKLVYGPAATAYEDGPAGLAVRLPAGVYAVEVAGLEQRLAAVYPELTVDVAIL